MSFSFISILRTTPAWWFRWERPSLSAYFQGSPHLFATSPFPMPPSPIPRICQEKAPAETRAALLPPTSVLFYTRDRLLFFLYAPLMAQSPPSNEEVRPFMFGPKVSDPSPPPIHSSSEPNSFPLDDRCPFFGSCSTYFRSFALDEDATRFQGSLVFFSSCTDPEGSFPLWLLGMTPRFMELPSPSHL